MDMRNESICFTSVILSHEGWAEISFVITKNIELGL